MSVEEALRTIKHECKRHIDCCDCPLRNVDDGCGVLDLQPDEWEFSEDIPPRIFK